MALSVLFFTKAAKSVGATTFNVRNIRECHSPQNSVHWPGKVPMVVGVNVKCVGWVGIALRENNRDGMKKPCITSREINVTCTGVSTGTSKSNGVLSVLPVLKMPSFR